VLIVHRNHANVKCLIRSRSGGLCPRGCLDAGPGGAHGEVSGCMDDCMDVFVATVDSEEVVCGCSRCSFLSLGSAMFACFEWRMQKRSELWLLVIQSA
jgi:hypothetical protein